MVLSRGVVCSANEASEDPPSVISNVTGVLLSMSMISVFMPSQNTAVNVVNLTVITVRLYLLFKSTAQHELNDLYGGWMK